MHGIGEETILVVEDDPQIRASNRRVLSRLGYSVLEATDGVEAMRILDRQGAAIDLVLTDVIMPRMGGIELAQTLQARFPNIKIIFTSGYTENSLGLNVAFLPKPYSSARLLETVEAALLQSPA